MSDHHDRGRVAIAGDERVFERGEYVVRARSWSKSLIDFDMQGRLRDQRLCGFTRTQCWADDQSRIASLAFAEHTPNARGIALAERRERAREIGHTVFSFRVTPEK